MKKTILGLIVIFILFIPVIGLAQDGDWEANQGSLKTVEPTDSGVYPGSDAKENQSPQLLKRLVVVLDAGHGGEDPGARSKNYEADLCEASVNWDIALRVKEYAEAFGAKVILTVKNPRVGIWDQDYLPCDLYRFMIFDDRKGGRVVAGPEGLFRRNNMANWAVKKYGREHKYVIFLSIHTDWMGATRKGVKVQGVHILVPKGQGYNLLSRALKARLGQFPSRLRNLEGESFTPLHPTGRDLVVLKSMDRAKKRFHGMDVNKIRDRVLLELGNLANEQDRLLLSSWDFRDEIAMRVNDSLIDYTNKRSGH